MLLIRLLNKFKTLKVPNPALNGVLLNNKESILINFELVAFK